MTVSSDYYGGQAGEIADDGAGWDDICDHDHDEECYDEADGRPSHCTHQHCFNCGECGCAGYCDDYQTYNLRPAETGGCICGPSSADPDDIDVRPDCPVHGAGDAQ